MKKVKKRTSTKISTYLFGQVFMGQGIFSANHCGILIRLASTFNNVFGALDSMDCFDNGQ